MQSLYLTRMLAPPAILYALSLSVASTQLVCVEVAAQTELVCKRYYLVSALKRTAKTVRTLNMHTMAQLAEALVTDADGAFLFNHPQIIDCWQRMMSNHSVKPLMRLWERLREYRWIDDL